MSITADEVGSNVVTQSLKKIPHSDSKVNEGGKRDGERLAESSDSSSKRAKMQGLDNHDPATSKTDKTEEYNVIVETQSSQVLDKNVVENKGGARHFDRVSTKSSMQRVNHNGSKPLDLNSELCTDENSGYNDTKLPIGDFRKNSSCDQKQKSSRGTHFDLNADDAGSSAIENTFYGYKSQNIEFGRRSTGCCEGKDALRKWKEMKKNGFISPSYGGIPAAPKQRGRKSKNDVFKQQMEQAKKEQIDKFTKMAAPTGLLNELNPGIINHVRNSKQVHSIIQALVRSEKKESRRQANELKAGSNEASERSSELENMNISEQDVSNNCYSKEQSCEEESLYTNAYSASQPKLSSPTVVSESISCLSNVESENVNSVDTLSVKAATVASQWLQLLQQDIKGRLAALRRSKKRVHAVITTELPSLLSKEFSSNQDSAAVGNSTAELHRGRWSKLFSQMDSTLSDEEKQLEHWFEQVNQMQVHCDQGLQYVQWKTLFGMQHFQPLDNQFRSQINDPEKELSMRAAAASIYSTCNFASSKENVSCC